MPLSKNSPVSTTQTPLGSPEDIKMPLVKPSSSTFVHKLYNMVVDNQYQHLITWSYTSSSFIVCNITVFSRNVLPKHFKHNNFSSFVRQLNMYGFHKINKSPRGQRTAAENQIWEFSHPRFLKDRPDLLDEIKRKSVETEARKENKNNSSSHGGGNDKIHSHMSVMQITYSEMVKQLASMQDKFALILRELAETKERQYQQQHFIKKMSDFLQQNDKYYEPISNDSPPIFITSHDCLAKREQHHQTRSTTLIVQPHNLHSSTLKLSPVTYHPTLSTPVSPCPSTLALVDQVPPQEFSLPNSFQNPFYS